MGLQNMLDAYVVRAKRNVVLTTAASEMHCADASTAKKRTTAGKKRREEQSCVVKCSSVGSVNKAVDSSVITFRCPIRKLCNILQNRTPTQTHIYNTHIYVYVCMNKWVETYVRRQLLCDKVCDSFFCSLLCMLNKNNE